MNRIIEIVGNEASGKSLIAYHIMANTQKMGGIVFYIDTERAYSKEFMARMGVRWDKKFVLANPTPSCIEEVFEYIEKVITLTRLKFPKKEVPVTIVWDSVAATQSKEEVENAFTDSSRLGAEARAMSRGFRKLSGAFEDGHVTLVCINQLREKIGVMFGNPDVTPHGKALGFYSSVRIKMSSHKHIKDTKSDRVIGISTKVRVFKNKVASPHREVDFPLFFDWGIQDEASWMDFMKDFEYVKSTSAWSMLKTDKKEYKFQGTTGWSDLLKDEEVRNFVLKKIEEHMVLKYDRPPDEVAQVDLDSALEVEQIGDSIKEAKKK